MKMLQTQSLMRACAVEMHMDMSQEPSYATIYMKNAAPKMDPEIATHTFVRATRSFFGRSRKTRGADFVRACAVEMHMDMAQEPLHAKIYRKNAGNQLEPPRSSTGLNLFHKNPVSTHYLFKKKRWFPPKAWGIESLSEKTYHNQPSIQLDQ